VLVELKKLRVFSERIAKLLKEFSLFFPSARPGVRVSFPEGLKFAAGYTVLCGQK
jgi:hypothetical protein